MKVKGLRWVVLSLIVLVTIINYLDRGTLNYMWVANTKVEVPAGEWTPPHHKRSSRSRPRVCWLSSQCSL